MVYIDREIMKEHIYIHNGLITKLNSFITSETSEDLKKVINNHIEMLNNHIKVMNHLINKEHFPIVEIKEFEPKTPVNDDEKYKVIDGLFNAKSMAKNNFDSAMMMKENDNVLAHIDMAEQNNKLFYQYKLLEKLN